MPAAVQAGGGSLCGQQKKRSVDREFPGFNVCHLNRDRGGSTLQIRIKRVYEPPRAEDGIRVLVDRLWPRGLRKEQARVDLWAKELAPSANLRQRFHQKGDFTAFRKEYRLEIDRKALDNLLERVKPGPVTLLYASKNERENNALVLMQLMQERIEFRGGRD